MLEQLYRRTGECNQCGDCCSDLPWAMRPESFRNWDPERLKKTWFPIIDLIPLIKVDEKDRKLKPKYEAKRVRLGTQSFHYIFTDEGLHKDLPPYGDVSTVSRDCPFLLELTEDGKRPCGLIGTGAEHIWHDHCAELNNGVPMFEAPKEHVDNWTQNNPNCSFEYVRVG